MVCAILFNMVEQLYIPSFDAAQLAGAVARLLSRISVELRPDVLDALREALVVDENVRARRALSMLVENARIADSKGVPVCQDTGSVWVYLEVGYASGADAADGGSQAAGDDAGAAPDSAPGSAPGSAPAVVVPGSNNTRQPLAIPADIFSQVDSAIRWVSRDRALRRSMLADALTDRTNTGDNTPALCELAFKPDLKGVRLTVMAKGGGSDNASQLAMLAPGGGWPAIKDFVLSAVSAKGANACPPLIIGVGVGSTFDKVASLSKQALLRPLGTTSQNDEIRQREAELLEAINNLGIGAGAMGGQTTALGVAIKTAACHIASLPVAVSIGCCAMRSATVQLTGEWCA